MRNDKARVREIDDKLDVLNRTLENIIPIWSQIDRKLKSVKLEISALEDERYKIMQGQLKFHDVGY
jgi:hypothetical protein